MTTQTKPILSFIHVTRTYPGPPHVVALRDCTLDVFAGDLVTICGPSGSGKSTWMALAGLLDRPTTGTITLNGYEVSTLSEAHRTAIRAQWLGLIFQSFHLMPHQTVAENIALGGMYAGIPRAARLQQAHEYAEQVGLSARVHALARNLSGGEMQRTAIARSLMATPKILLCDEPTGNLDSRNASQVMGLLRELNRDGKCIAVITHDAEIAASGSRRLTVLDGVMSANV